MGHYSSLPWGCHLPLTHEGGHPHPSNIPSIRAWSPPRVPRFNPPFFFDFECPPFCPALWRRCPPFLGVHGCLHLSLASDSHTRESTHVLDHVLHRPGFPPTVGSPCCTGIGGGRIGRWRARDRGWPPRPARTVAAPAAVARRARANIEEVDTIE